MSDWPSQAGKPVDSLEELAALLRQPAAGTRRLLLIPLRLPLFNRLEIKDQTRWFEETSGKMKIYHPSPSRDLKNSPRPWRSLAPLLAFRFFPSEPLDHQRIKIRLYPTLCYIFRCLSF